MKIIHLTDIHSDYNWLVEILTEIKPDIVLISGDITHFGHKNEVKSIIEAFQTITKNVFAVTGNCDYPDCNEYLSEININAENKLIQFESFQVIGLAGSLPCPGKTPYEFDENYYNEKLVFLKNKIILEKPLVLLTHQPPYKTKNDKVQFGWHVGSKSIRRFIEEVQPIVCLTGHIHEGKGVDYIGKCQIINPGPAKNKHFALIEFTGKLSPEISLF